MIELQRKAVETPVWKDARVITVASLALLLLFIAAISPVSNAASDPHFSLIVSQSLLERGSLQLDPYRDSHPEHFESFFWQTVTIDGHTYYNYPLAPTVVALPAVAVARMAGLDMLNRGHNELLQNALSALTCALTLILVYVLVSYYVDHRIALLLTVLSTFGSPLVSTGATAYWNLNVAVIFILLALILLVRFERRSCDIHPYLLGLFLFSAYYARPSAAIFILVVFIYLFVKNRPALLRTAVTSFVLLVLFILHSRLQYGLWLPIYYTTSQWFNPQGLFRPLYGVTFSPSRGLFIFSPFFLPAIVGAVWPGGRLQSRLLFWLCALWVTLQLLSVAMTRQWYGGFSYGPRLMTDAVPALVLMSAIFWRDVGPKLRVRAKQLVLLVIVVTGLIAIFINSYQGLFNTKTALWNAYPNIDEHPELLFDWRYPQFLTTLETFHERRLNFHLARIAAGEHELTPYQWGESYTPSLQTDRAIWHGWWPDTSNQWWSETPVTSVILALDGAEPGRLYALEIQAASPQQRHAMVALNGVELGVAHFDAAPQTFRYTFDGSLIGRHNIARITMEVPELLVMPPWTAITWSDSYEPHKLGLKDAVVRLVPLSEQ